MRFDVSSFFGMQTVRVISAERDDLVASALRTSTGGKQKRPIWIITVTPFRFGRRATLAVSRENFFTELASAIGFRDLRTGFDDFDQAFRLKSDQPSIAQDALQSSDVRAAIEALFSQHVEWARGDAGGLQIRAQRGGDEVEGARNLLDRALSLAVALERAL